MSSRRPSRILIVDDSMTKAYILKSLLDKAGYLVDTVTSGKDVLAYLRTRTPDLILLDVVMPGLNGFEVCRTIKTDQEHQSIPIIFITTLTHTKARLEGFDAGGEDYISEPFVEEEVLARVNVTLRRKRAEEDLLRKTQELESYTYVVSHDLKEPLRSIIRFSEIVSARYRDRFDDEGQEILRHIDSACRRMTAMIDDLLVLSRAGRVDAGLEEVDLAELVAETRLDLAELINRKNATIELSGLPVIVCQRAWLSEVFKNLISNGLKYNQSPQPVVTITGEEQEDIWELTVSDNGIGIAPEHWERIFGLFQRLHHRDQYEGTGAGLAIVRSIIEQHEGRIWIAASSPDIGTVFKLTISKELGHAASRGDS
jgi:signal transduction histidine kinase